MGQNGKIITKPSLAITETLKLKYRYTLNYGNFRGKKLIKQYLEGDCGLDEIGNKSIFVCMCRI